MAHETHELYTHDDFTEEETARGGRLAVAVVTHGIPVCKRCGDSGAELERPCRAYFGGGGIGSPKIDIFIGGVLTKRTGEHHRTLYDTETLEIENALLKSMPDDTLLNLIQKLKLEAIARGLTV
jgi:hypothetical protein